MPNFEQWAAIGPHFLSGTAVIVFLDFDGVLHPDPCQDVKRLFENGPRLARTLGEFPQAVVVLSTAWRQVRTFDQMVKHLPAKLRPFIIGTTPNFNDITTSAALVPYRRQAECMHWMQHNRLQDEAWLAIDDRPGGFTPYCESLITCDPQTGFDAEAAARLRSALVRHFQRHGSTVDLLID